MRKVVLVAGVVLALAGCARGGGLNRNRPDEFAVARQPPLVIPPDFALVPPQPGAARVQTNTGQEQTLQALFGGNTGRSTGESQTLSEAGADAADPGIRSAVGDQGTTVVDKGSTTRDVVAAPEGDGQDAKTATPQ
jgi:hypothetical protein